MKASEIVGRCFKARVVSWLNSNQVGAVIPTSDGNGLIIAVYDNGRYVEPEQFQVPNSPAELWGPDGPIYRSTTPPEETPPEAPTEEEPPADDST